MKHWIVAACALGAVVAPALANGAAPSERGQQIVTARCTTCHAASQVYAARHTEAEWRSVMTRMTGHGAQLSGAERAELLKFLTAKTSGKTGKGK